MRVPRQSPCGLEPTAGCEPSTCITPLTRNRRGLTSRFAAAATRPSRPLIYQVPRYSDISLGQLDSGIAIRIVTAARCWRTPKPTLSCAFGSEAATANGGAMPLPLAGSRRMWEGRWEWSGGLPAWPIVWHLPLVTWIGWPHLGVSIRQLSHGFAPSRKVPKHHLDSSCCIASQGRNAQCSTPVP